MSTEATQRRLSRSNTGSIVAPLEYKWTEVGVIPENWEVRNLGTLGQFKNGINKNKKEFEHGFPFVNLMDVFGAPRISTNSSFGLVNSSLAEREAYALENGDVLFVRSSVKPVGVGLTTLISEDLPDTVFSGFLIRYRDNGAFALKFKEHCFWKESFRNRLISSSTVSANTNINQESLKSLQIAFPPNKAEQTAIAEVLSDVDSLLGTLDTLIAKKRAIKQAVMQQLLAGKTRLPSFSGEWKTKRLGKIGSFSKGRNIRLDDVLEDGHPCIRYGELYTRYHNYINTPISHISPAVADTAPPIKTDDLLFASSGETTEEIGRCAAYLGDAPAFAGGDIVVFRPIGQNSMFLGHLINHPVVTTQRARFGQGDAVVHTSAQNLAQLEVCLPPREEQTAIATVLSDMDAEISALERRRDKIHSVKLGMMQQLLTGRMRLVKPESLKNNEEMA